jgi:putative endonuclease
MFYVYGIQSEVTGKLYTGQTEDIEKRLRQHNDPSNDFSEYTKHNKGPWRLLYKEEIITRFDALKREKFLKSGKGRQYIKRLLLGSSAGRAGGC